MWSYFLIIFIILCLRRLYNGRSTGNETSETTKHYFTATETTTPEKWYFMKTLCKVVALFLTIQENLPTTTKWFKWNYGYTIDKPAPHHPPHTGPSISRIINPCLHYNAIKTNISMSCLYWFPVNPSFKFNLNSIFVSLKLMRESMLPQRHRWGEISGLRCLITMMQPQLVLENG